MDFTEGTMTPNRVVATLTPLVFAPLAGAISTLAARYFPGVDVPASSLEEIFIAGALIAFAKAAQWTQGWQKWEAREARREETAQTLDAREADIAAREAELSFEDGEPLEAEEDLLGFDEELDEEPLDSPEDEVFDEDEAFDEEEAGGEPVPR